MSNSFRRNNLPLEPTEQELARLRESLDRLAANEATNCDDVPLFNAGFVGRRFRKESRLVGGNSRCRRGAALLKAAACLVLLLGCSCGAVLAWRGEEVLAPGGDKAASLELALNVASVEEVGDASLAAFVEISAGSSEENVMLTAVDNGAVLVNGEERSTSSLSAAASSAPSAGEVVVTDPSLCADNAAIRKTVDEMGVSEEVARTALFIEGLRGAVFEVNVGDAQAEAQLDLSAFPTLRDVVQRIEDSGGVTHFPLVLSDERRS